MNTKNNQRSRDTDERIVRAVFEAMVREKKPVSKVTVREVCEKAGINRSTFYAHFLDVYDVMEQVEKSMATGLTQRFLDILDGGGDMGQCFLALFEYIREYQQFYTFYLNESNRTGVIGVTWELLSDRLQGMTPQDFGYTSLEEITYQGTFFTFGLTAVIRRWVSRGCPESPRELLDYLERQYRPNLKLFGFGGDQ